MTAHPKIVLVVGQAKSGKTTFALKLIEELRKHKKVQHLNADVVREAFGNWDFTIPGRILQAQRMCGLIENDNDFVVIDMIAPLQEQRDIINPDFMAWMDTLSFDVYGGDVPFEAVSFPRLYRVKDNRKADAKFLSGILLRDWVFDHTFYAEV